jgi:hypothetical protein
MSLTFTHNNISYTFVRDFKMDEQGNLTSTDDTVSYLQFDYTGDAHGSILIKVSHLDLDVDGSWMSTPSLVQAVSNIVSDMSP